MVDKLRLHGQVFQAVVKGLEVMHEAIVDVELVGLVHLIFHPAEPGALQFRVYLVEFRCDSLEIDLITL